MHAARDELFMGQSNANAGMTIEFAAEEAKDEDEESKPKRKGPFKFLRRNQGNLAGNQTKGGSSRGTRNQNDKGPKAPRWGHVKSRVSSRLDETQQAARREASRRRREGRLEELQRAKRTARSLQERLQAHGEERRYVQAREAGERQVGAEQKERRRTGVLVSKFLAHHSPVAHRSSTLRGTTFHRMPATVATMITTTPTTMAMATVTTAIS